MLSPQRPRSSTQVWLLLLVGGGLLLSAFCLVGSLMFLDGSSLFQGPLQTMYRLGEVNTSAPALSPGLTAMPTVAGDSAATLVPQSDAHTNDNPSGNVAPAPAGNVGPVSTEEVEPAPVIPAPADSAAATLPLRPAPQWSDATRAFWQDFLDALNAHDVRRVADKVAPIFLIFGPMRWGTPTPPQQVAQWLVDAATAGPVTCVGYDANSIVLEFARPLQVAGVGNFGTLLVFVAEGQTINRIQAYLDPEARFYYAFWPCVMTGLQPAAMPASFILWATEAREAPEAAIEAVTMAVRQASAEALEKRMFPWVTRSRLFSEGGTLQTPSAARADIIPVRNSEGVTCIGYALVEDYLNTQLLDLYLGHGNYFINLRLVPDVQGRYRIHAHSDWHHQDSFYTYQELQPCPDTVPAWEPASEVPIAPEDEVCRDSPRRLSVGHEAYICTQYDKLILRAGPTKLSDELTRVAPGTSLTVLDGPVCDHASGMWYWQVEVDGLVGWMAEGGDAVDPYYLCPMP